MKVLLPLLFLTTLNTAQAAQVQIAPQIGVLAKATDYSCAYFSRRVAEVLIVISDPTFDGTENLGLEYGLQTSEAPNSWTGRTKIAMHWNRASWVTVRDITLTERSTPLKVQSLAFRILKNEKRMDDVAYRVQLLDLKSACSASGEPDSRNYTEIKPIPISNEP